MLLVFVSFFIKIPSWYLKTPHVYQSLSWPYWYQSLSYWVSTMSSIYFPRLCACYPHHWFVRSSAQVHLIPPYAPRLVQVATKQMINSWIHLGNAVIYWQIMDAFCRKDSPKEWRTSRQMSCLTWIPLWSSTVGVIRKNNLSMCEERIHVTSQSGRNVNTRGIWERA